MNLQEDLAQLTGSEHHYMHWTRLLRYTDGVKFIAEKYGAYWIIDLVASYQPVKGEGLDDFQLWRLKVRNGKAIMTCRADSDQPAIITQKIECTDFPESIRFYVENGVLLLPGEH